MRRVTTTKRMTYDECCSGRDWRVHTTKRLWLGFGRSIHRDISSIHHSQMLSSLLLGSISIWAPAKTSDILEQLHQDIDTWYHHETLRNDRGDTKNDDSWYTCSPDFIANIKSSGTMRDTQKTMTISATSFRGCNRFSPLLICQPKKTRNHCKLTPKILTVVKQLRFQIFKLHPCFLSVNFQNNHIFQAPLPPPPRFRFRCLVFYHQHFFSQSRRRLVGLPPWKEVQLTSHLKGSWVKRHGGLLNDPCFAFSQICGCFQK